MSTNTILTLRPRQVIRQLPWHFDSKMALGGLLILAIFSLVGWVYLTQASTVTETSYHVDELRIELEQLENQNGALMLEIAQLESLARVEQRAKELGFQTTNKVQYLAIEQYPTLSSDDISPYRGTIQVYSKAEVTQIGQNQLPWWNNLLDNTARWLEGR